MLLKPREDASFGEGYMLRLLKIEEVDIKRINAITGGDLRPSQDVTLECTVAETTVRVTVRIDDQTTDEEYLRIGRQIAVKRMREIADAMDVK